MLEPLKLLCFVCFFWNGTVKKTHIRNALTCHKFVADLHNKIEKINIPAYVRGSWHKKVLGENECDMEIMCVVKYIKWSKRISTDKKRKTTLKKIHSRIIFHSLIKWWFQGWFAFLSLSAGDFFLQLKDLKFMSS